MNKEIKSIVKKTAKIAGVTCVAAGAVALVTSAAAIKAMTEGARYLKNTVKKIIDEESKAEVVVGEAVETEAPMQETVASEEDFKDSDAEDAATVQEAAAE